MSKPVYLKRDDENNIVAISMVELDGFTEIRKSNDVEVIEFMGLAEPRDDENPLIESDLGIIRVIEDLIQLLINKNVISLTELPEAAQDKLLNRRQLRATIIDILNVDSEMGFDENIDV